jgi:hypothetical protein
MAAMYGNTKWRSSRRCTYIPTGIKQTLQCVLPVALFIVAVVQTDFAFFSAANIDSSWRSLAVK